MNLPQNLFDGNVSIQTFLCQPDKTIIGEILPYDFNTTFKFNTYSEISFTIDRYYNDLFDGKTKVNPYYDSIESLRVIYLRGIGHFIIQDVKEDVSDNENKSVTCFSLEYATGQKYLESFYVNTGEEGSIETMYHAQQYGAEYAIDNYYTLVTTQPFDPYERYYIREYTNEKAYNYVEVQILDEADFIKQLNEEEEIYIKTYPNVRFYWPTCPELSLLHNVFDRIPEWKIGHVDKELWYQERTFSEDRTAVYDFLYNTAAETLKYVMVWDSINGVVNFYKTEEDGVTANTYVRTNVYNPNFIYYLDTNGTVAAEQPKNADDVINGVFYIDVGNNIETQWDTDVFISRENLASALNISYSTDDIKTKLKVVGNEGLDIRDVNLGQSYILNLSYYNTPEWLGEDLHLKYNSYMAELAECTEEYRRLISQWSAAYNEYSDLMNYIPLDPRVMLVGDEFKKLYCVYNNSYDFLTPDETKEMEKLQKGGNVDLFNCPQISSTVLIEAGWTVVDNSTVILFAQTYSNDQGDIAINLTPILSDDNVLSPDELKEYAQSIIESIIAGTIKDDLNLKIGATFRGDGAVSNAKDALERIRKLQNKFYFGYGLSVEKLVEKLQTKLEHYKVDQDTDGKGTIIPSTTARSDDILLTLENDRSDSATIRVRYDQNDTSEKPSYRVYRTLTTASTGIITTKDFSLKDWITGDIVSANVFDDEYGKFKIKSIGTLGAFFCLARDETNIKNVENYGIRLLEEKKATYTKIFITQTEGYMNNEDAQCIVSNERPEGEIAIGTKWLDADTIDEVDKDGNAVKLYMEIYTGSTKDNGWEEYDIEEDLSSYEDYIRFAENYTKLGNVQAVLLEKQRQADYLLNGVPVNAIRLTNDNINLNSLLRAALIHFIVLENDFFVANLGDTLPEDIEEGTIWFQTVDNGHYLYTTIKQWKENSWVTPTTTVEKILLTGYEKDYGVVTFIANPDYSQVSEAEEYSADTIYFLYRNEEYVKPQVQPSSTDDLQNIYECQVTNEIAKDTECLFEIDQQQYSFIAPQIIQRNSMLVYNKSTNTLTVGIDSIEPMLVEDATNMLILQFNKRVYYIIDGTEYAVYVNDGIPYVSYAHSQGVCLSKMNMLKEASDMNTYFSEQERMRLSPFIREDEFADNNFLLTGYESEEEQMNIKQELLNAGVEELQKICQPKLSFDATMANILTIPEFEPLKNQFKLGNFILREQDCLRYKLILMILQILVVLLVIL